MAEREEINDSQEIALRCHDISTGLGNVDVPEFEVVPEIGLMVRLALIIRGLPRIEYETLKLVAAHYLQINAIMLRQILYKLGDIEFIKITSDGETIKFILPTVPFYDDLYEQIGDYALLKHFNEPEQLAIEILKKLTLAPMPQDMIYKLGAEKSLVKRSLQIGEKGNYIVNRRCRGKDILISPVFFSENIDIYTDLVAKAGAKTVKKILELIKNCQGIPLSVIEKTGEINGTKITSEEVNMLKRLAHDGSVKPPSIKTSHAGTNHFLFTPTPGKARLNPTKREIYERSMALVSAVRQGQYLPKEFAIKSPYHILKKLRESGYIGANTEAFEQYKSLTFMRVGRLQKTVGGFYRFVLIDSEENKEALDIAIDLVTVGSLKGLEVDDIARIALTQDQTYIESIIGSAELRNREQVSLSAEQKFELDNIFLRSV